MKIDILVAEIGSTTTLVNAFSGIGTDNPRFMGQGQASTSVLDGDVRIGLNGAVEDLCRGLGGGCGLCSDACHIERGGRASDVCAWIGV